MKSFVSLNLNQPDIAKYGFLDDFRRAERNVQLSGNPNPASCAGCEPLVLLPRLPRGGLLDQPLVVSLIATGQPGELAYLYKNNDILNLFPSPWADGALLLGNGGQQQLSFPSACGHARVSQRAADACQLHVWKGAERYRRRRIRRKPSGATRGRIQRAFGPGARILRRYSFRQGQLDLPASLARTLCASAGGLERSAAS